MQSISSGSARPDPEPSPHPSHRHERAGAVPEPTGPAEGDDGAWFTVVLRGYDRTQVDTRLADLDRRIHEEIRRAETAESSLSASRAHVRRLQEQLESATPATSAESPASSGDAGFGRRVERVLQAAEQEAAELRERAAADAEEIRGLARAEAESHRHRTEEALLGRAATLDREFTARSSALDDREREADEQLAAARDEAAELRASARTELDRAREDATRLRSDAERAGSDRRAGIIRDVERLSALRDDVRAELTRVRESLGAELDREPVAAALDDDLFGFSDDRWDDDDRPSATSAADPLGSGDDAVPPGSRSADGDADGDAPGTLVLGPGRLPERGASDDETTIGRIPPISLASIGVLPFGDLAAGGDKARTRTDGTNGAPRGYRGPTRGPVPGRRSR